MRIRDLGLVCRRFVIVVEDMFACGFAQTYKNDGNSVAPSRCALLIGNMLITDKVVQHATLSSGTCDGPLFVYHQSTWSWNCSVFDKSSTIAQRARQANALDRLSPILHRGQ